MERKNGKHHQVIDRDLKTYKSHDVESGNEKETKIHHLKISQESAWFRRWAMVILLVLSMLMWDSVLYMKDLLSFHKESDIKGSVAQKYVEKYNNKYSYINDENKRIFDAESDVRLVLDQIGIQQKADSFDKEKAILEVILNRIDEEWTTEQIDREYSRRGIETEYRLLKERDELSDALEAIKIKTQKIRTQKLEQIRASVGYSTAGLVQVVPKQVLDKRTIVDAFDSKIDSVLDENHNIQSVRRIHTNLEDESSQSEARDYDFADEEQEVNNSHDRSLVHEARSPAPEFVKFAQDLRSENIYVNVNKKNDMERALKQIGYKQKSKNSKKQPLWLGNEISKCPDLKTEARLSFCPYYIPLNKANHYAYFKEFAERNPSCKLQADYYPPTWRLFKEKERAALKLDASQEGVGEYEVSYVRKFTVPGSNYMKSAGSVYEQLEKSSKSVKLLTKESKNKAIVQRYINDPMLIQGKKFVIRTYGVIVNSKPFIVFYSDGMVLRSLVPYNRFTTLNGDYKKAAHITSEQKATSKTPLKSSELYMPFSMLSKYLESEGGFEKGFLQNWLRPQMKARMIHALYSITRRQRAEEDEDDDVGPAASNDGKADPQKSAVIQTTCFDFILDSSKKLWLINLGTGSHCFVSMGGSSFKPSWKSNLQTHIGDNMVRLGEEMLWRRENNQDISSTKFFTDVGMVPLIDESFEDWNTVDEINAHMEGRRVDQDFVVQSEDIDEENEDELIVMEDGEDEASTDDMENDDEEG